ncbi:MAG TPA: peptide-methionine (S)-S-oxide reductase MsrA [Geminicoccaceae bacterium]|nr:peptide-methionine (S)-S-oxide reductase MsrA [Geminicoccaceae bacterium]
MGKLATGLIAGLAIAATVAGVAALAQDPAIKAAPGAQEALEPGQASAIFAGGCFWCMEPPYDALDGVISTTSGYTGGMLANPTYEQVSAGGTGHAEAVRVVYDPSKIAYEQLVDVFWHNVDPTQVDGQFCDHGHQYRTAIFYADDEQKRIAEQSLAELEKNKPFAGEIVTEIVAAGAFYPAEDYHQDYYQKNPLRYKYYRWACGRDQRLSELWGDMAPHS